MKYCACILVILFFGRVLWAQPEPPCFNFSVVLDKVKGVDNQTANIFIGSIRLKKGLYNATSCAAVNLLRADTSCYELTVAAQQNPNCRYETRYSPVTGKTYLERYDLQQPVLVLESGTKKMYIVFNRLPQFERELFAHDRIIAQIGALDYKQKVQPYFLYLYSLEFIEGVFFLKEDYRNTEQWAKRITAEELYVQMNGKKDDVFIYAPYTGGFDKAVHGNFSSQEAAQVILSRQPLENGWQDALDFAKWKAEHGFIRPTGKKSFLTALRTLENKSRQRKDSLLALSATYHGLELFERYDNFCSTDFFCILDNDRELLEAFSNYFKDPRDVKKTIDINKANGYKTNEQQLKKYYWQTGDQYRLFTEFIINNNYLVTREKMKQFVNSTNKTK